MPDAPVIPVLPPSPPPPGGKCGTCGHLREVKMDKPGTMATKGQTKFRPLTAKRGRGRPRVNARDKRRVEFY